jgi:hypothetical protein
VLPERQAHEAALLQAPARQSDPVIPARAAAEARH